MEIKTSLGYEVEGVMFRFDHKARVECGGWWHIAHALNGSANVIEEILNTPTIKALPDPIPDDFPSQQV